MEQYQIDLKEGSERAERAMNDELRTLCSREVPGDTQRGLAIYPSYAQRTFKHILLPVWVLSYNYVGKPYQMLINGYTGTVARALPEELGQNYAARPSDPDCRCNHCLARPSPPLIFAGSARLRRCWPAQRRSRAPGKCPASGWPANRGGCSSRSRPRKRPSRSETPEEGSRIRS